MCLYSSVIIKVLVPVCYTIFLYCLVSLLIFNIPPKYCENSHSRDASEMSGCTPWMDTLNRLWALLRNANLSPFKLKSQPTKCCAALSELNLTSIDFLDLETCNSSKCSGDSASLMIWRTSSLLMSNFSCFVWR